MTRPTDEEIATVLRPLAEAAETWSENVSSSLQLFHAGEDVPITVGLLRAAHDLLSRLEAQSGEETTTHGWWNYSINYGPDGEENYANVYTDAGQLVGNLRIGHARDIVGGLNAAKTLNQEGGDAADTARAIDRGPRLHVAPPASASSGSGRAEVTGGDLINALIVASNDYECSVPRSSDELRLLRKKLVAAKQTLLDHIVHMHDVGFVSGCRSMQEEAARVAEGFPTSKLVMWDRPGSPPGNGYMPTNPADVAAAIRAINPETKP